MKKKDFKDNKKGLIKRIISKEDDEIKKLKELKKKIKKINSVEELEALEEELDELGLLEEALASIQDKKKKKKRKTDREIFEERVRVNLDIINRTVMVGKLFKSKERDRKIEGLLNKLENNEEKVHTDRIRDKDQELKREMEERSKSGQKAKDRGERSR